MNSTVKPYKSLSSGEWQHVVISWASIISMCLSVAIVIINLTVLFVMAVYKRSRPQGLFFIANLIIADLLFPISDVALHTVLKYDAVAQSSTLDCNAYVFLFLSAMFASTGNIAMVTLDRYIAVTRPFKYKEILSATRTTTLIVLNWIVAITLSSIGTRAADSRRSSNNCLIFHGLGQNLGTFVCLVLVLSFLILLIAYTVIAKEVRNNLRRTEPLVQGRFEHLSFDKRFQSKNGHADCMHVEVEKRSSKKKVNTPARSETNENDGPEVLVDRAKDPIFAVPEAGTHPQELSFHSTRNANVSPINAEHFDKFQRRSSNVLGTFGVNCDHKDSCRHTVDKNTSKTSVVLPPDVLFHKLSQFVRPENSSSMVDIKTEINSVALERRSSNCYTTTEDNERQKNQRIASFTMRKRLPRRSFPDRLIGHRMKNKRGRLLKQKSLGKQVLPITSSRELVDSRFDVSESETRLTSYELKKAVFESYRFKLEQDSSSTNGGEFHAKGFSKAPYLSQLERALPIRVTRERTLSLPGSNYSELVAFSSNDNPPKRVRKSIPIIGEVVLQVSDTPLFILSPLVRIKKRRRSVAIPTDVQNEFAHQKEFPHQNEFPHENGNYCSIVPKEQGLSDSIVQLPNFAGKSEDIFSVSYRDEKSNMSKREALISNFTAGKERSSVENVSVPKHEHLSYDRKYSLCQTLGKDLKISLAASKPRRRDKKTIHAAASILGLFFVNWMPLVFCLTYQLIDDELSQNFDTLAHIAYVCTHFNALFNPILYVTRTRGFKSALQKIKDKLLR